MTKVALAHERRIRGLLKRYGCNCKVLYQIVPHIPIEIGVDKLKYGCDVFPWYHEPYEYNADLEMPRNKLSFEKTVKTQHIADLFDIFLNLRSRSAVRPFFS